MEKLAPSRTILSQASTDPFLEDDCLGGLCRRLARPSWFVSPNERPWTRVALSDRRILALQLEENTANGR